jgi:hypothetical protein
VDKQTKILIVDDDIALRQEIKSLIQSMNEDFEIQRDIQSNYFDLHNFHRKYNEPKLEAPVEHGAYRQFIKRDKRKNFKVRK